jgi:hypothetical protein
MLKEVVHTVTAGIRCVNWTVLAVKYRFWLYTSGRDFAFELRGALNIGFHLLAAGDEIQEPVKVLGDEQTT